MAENDPFASPPDDQPFPDLRLVARSAEPHTVAAGGDEAVSRGEPAPPVRRRVPPARARSRG